MAESPDARNDSSILDLTTLIERPSIAIDGERYEIVSPDELSAVEHQRLTAWGRRLDELLDKASLSEKEAKELTKAVQQLSDAVMVGVPAEVRATLTDAQRMQVSQVFSMLSLRRRTRTAAAAARWGNTRAAGSIGVSSQASSSASTAEIPGGGSTAAPSPSCAPTSQ